eukprot:CAMPEP_0116046774 /NCGR_PEP_ID=MMETSP0321-20121206/28470_1 /TAXON_ID=163516 /ORGANISM="Leptocylindrus danicus var. danicus, Strain B650" /LENGTH=747 /DNA_ID=CAMNT_0003528475 /DNA_START=157 /DNA_END=2401 /DNA_ORIENTATION=-
MTPRTSNNSYSNYSPSSSPCLSYPSSPTPLFSSSGSGGESILNSSILSGFKQPQESSSASASSPRHTRKVTFLQDTLNSNHYHNNNEGILDTNTSTSTSTNTTDEALLLQDKMARLRVYNEKAASPGGGAQKKTNHGHTHGGGHAHNSSLDTIEEEGSDKEDGAWMMGLLQWSLEQEDFDRSSSCNGYGLNSFTGPLTPSNSERGSEPAWSERGSEWGSEWSSERGSDWGGSEWGELVDTELDESDWEPLPLNARSLRDMASLRGESNIASTSPSANANAIVPDLAPTLSNVSSSSANTLTNFYTVSSAAGDDAESVSSTVATSVDLNETVTTANTTIDIFVAVAKKLNDRAYNHYSSTGSVTSTNTASSRRSNVVDHTYVDYSICEDHEGALLIGNPIHFMRDEEGQVFKIDIQDPITRSSKFKRNCDAARNTFPKTLRFILSQPNLTSIVSWLPHGRSFLVHNAKKMESDILPRFFKQTKIKSFLRQLNKWGFKRITKKGVDEGSYYHEYFLRGKLTLSGNMKYVKVKGEGNKQWQSNPDEEPDFYALAEVRPLLDHAGRTTTTPMSHGIQHHGPNKYQQPSQQVHRACPQMITSNMHAHAALQVPASSPRNRQHAYPMTVHSAMPMPPVTSSMPTSPNAMNMSMMSPYNPGGGAAPPAVMMPVYPGQFMHLHAMGANNMCMSTMQMNMHAMNYPGFVLPTRGVPMNHSTATMPPRTPSGGASANKQSASSSSSKAVPSITTSKS